MTKKKSTKRALISSLLILAMCFTMLAGTTFAWFTDSVTSSNNRILAGKLKVDLVMNSGNGYVSIADGQGDIFKEAATANNSTVTLWEPGKTQIVYLGVENKGNLALKYNIILSIADRGLAGALQYVLADGVEYNNVQATKWDDIKADAAPVVAGTITAAPNGKLDVGETDYFALAVHMDELAGNEYQEKDVIIDVAVVATQATVEEDSFGNQYDALAEFPVIKAADTSALRTAIADAENGDIITVTGDIDDYIVINTDKEITIDLGGNTITGDSDGAFFVYDGTVTLKNGTIDADYFGILVAGATTDKNPHVIIGEGVTVKGDYPIFVRKSYGTNTEAEGNATVDIYGKVEGILFVDGNMKTGDTVINIYGEIENDDVAVALNGKATVNVKEGAKITGTTGIEVRAGKLTVEGGTITGTAQPSSNHYNGSGTSTAGAGVGVSYYGNATIDVSITNGNISGYTPLYIVNPNGTDYTGKVKVSVTGGTFNIINGGAQKFYVAPECTGIDYSNIYA
ncbi:MAG: hypothetical protein IJL83_05745 [Clostridia bacterium]|nr:hypothetical protein [Clostridia bacterium]